MTINDIQWTSPLLTAKRFRKSSRLALAAACVLACVALALALIPGIANLDLAVEAVIVAVVTAVSLALMYYRPILFPLVAFFAAVPFDNLLQTGGGTITKFLALASAGAILLVMCNRKRTMTPSIAMAGWGAFLLWSFASLIWAKDPAFGLGSLMQVVQLFLLCLILAMLRIRMADVRWMMLATLTGGVACALYGIYMFVSGHVQRTDALSSRLDISLGANSYINADHYAGALVFPLAIALVAFLRLDGWKRVIAAVSFTTLVAGILVSATRGSLVSLAIMGIYLAFVERRRLQLLVLGGIGLLTSLAMPNVWLRFVDSQQGDLGGRNGIWAIGLNAFRTHMLAGSGTGNFRLAYGEAYLMTPQKGLFTHRWAEDSHNLIVNTSVELGIIGVVLILIAWYLQFRTVSKISRDSSFGAVRSAIEAGTIGLFMVAMAVDLMWYKYLWIAFMLGVLARNAWITSADPVSDP